MEYVLYYHDPSDRWAVMGRQVGADYWTQVSRWYVYRGNAEHKLSEIRKGA